MRFDRKPAGQHRADLLAPFSAARPASTLPAAGPQARPRLRHPSLQVLEAMLRLAGPQAQLLSHAERPWASATFSGTRHTITLLFDGAGAVAAAEALIAALPEHEFTIRGQLVADATVSEVLHTLLPAERMVVEADLLLLAEG
ncbi:MAG TPA: hypothetical protein VFF98_01955 [Novosphingobium sp.]|nr:hypothetical protein [Novosphingobium sp.]HZV08237.1 hypothetical protein [Novosphingobium sp.]